MQVWEARYGFSLFPKRKEWEKVLSVNIEGDHYGHYDNHR